MKNNILNIYKIVLFGLVFLFYYIFLTVYMTPDSYNIDNISGFYGEEKNSFDVIYYGGSAAFVYNEPLRLFYNYGIASYNFACDTMQAELYKYMIKETLKYQNPKLLIIDARPFEYRTKEIPPSSYAYRKVLFGMRSGKNRYNLVKDLVPKYLNDDISSYYFNLEAYHENGKLQSLDKTFKIIFNKYRSQYKGFYFYNYEKIPYFERVDYSTDNVSDIGGETDKILDDLLEFLKSIDKDVLFVVSPYVEKVEHKEMFNYVQKKILDNGFHFLDSNDYYEETGIDYANDFFDANHVNLLGSIKYTDFLGNYLLENFELVDRRDDANYKAWHDYSKNWNKKVESSKKKILNLIEKRE